jgi:hypothetical protein
VSEFYCIQLGRFWDKKYAKQNAVGTEEKLDETGVGLEHSLNKSVMRLI